MANALLVDTNFSSGPILAFLKHQGHTVYCCGGKPTDHLAKATEGYIPLDYSDPNALRALCEELNIAHLVPGCNDLSYWACAQVSAQHPFTGLDSVETTHTLNNKAHFRQFAQRQGLSVPTVFDVQHALPQQAVVVKPVDAFSGKGITIVEHPTRQALDLAIQSAQHVSRSGAWVVEQYIEGQLYSHSAFIAQGRIVQDFLVIEHGSANRFVVDTSHMALNFPTALLANIRAEIEHMAHTLALCDGLLHTQFIVQNNRFYLIETTRRCPGDLYSQLIELSTGFPYAASYAMPFLGLSVQPQTTTTRHILRHTLTLPQASVLAHLQFEGPLNIERWVPLATTGDPIAPSPHSRIALLFAHCPTQAELHTLATRTTARQLYRING